MAHRLLEPFKNVAWHFTGYLKMRFVNSTERKLSVLTAWMCVCVCECLCVCVCLRVSIAGSSQVKCACETEPFKEILKRLHKVKRTESERSFSCCSGRTEETKGRKGGTRRKSGSREIK